MKSKYMQTVSILLFLFLFFSIGDKSWGGALVNNSPNTNDKHANSLESLLSQNLTELKIQNSQKQSWLEKIFPQILAALVGVIGFLVSMQIEKHTRIGELDQSIHEKRLEIYPKIVEIGLPFALHFPIVDKENLDVSKVDGKSCLKMGRQLSTWYYETGGLLLSKNSFDNYLLLSKALLKASRLDELCTPDYNDMQIDIDLKSAETEIGIMSFITSKSVESFEFGINSSDGNNIKGGVFKDYVFLRKLFSQMRTSLIKDIRGRRRPYQRDEFDYSIN